MSRSSCEESLYYSQALYFDNNTQTHKHKEAKEILVPRMSFVFLLDSLQFQPTTMNVSTQRDWLSLITSCVYIRGAVSITWITSGGQGRTDKIIICQESPWPPGQTNGI